MDSSLNPSFPNHAFLDILLATTTTITTFKQNPHLQPSLAATIAAIGTLKYHFLNGQLNSYLEFNGFFYSQDKGGTMEPPLIVELAEIRLAEVETLA